MILTAKKHKGWAAAVAAALVFTGYEIGSGIGTSQDTADKALNKAEEATLIAKAVHAGQVANCHFSVRPHGVRFIIADRIKKDRHRAAALKPYKRAFPGIPNLRHLLRIAKQQDRGEIRDLLDETACAAPFMRKSVRGR